MKTSPSIATPEFTQTPCNQPPIKALCPYPLPWYRLAQTIDCTLLPSLLTEGFDLNESPARWRGCYVVLSGSSSLLHDPLVNLLSMYRNLLRRVYSIFDLVACDGKYCHLDAITNVDGSPFFLENDGMDMRDECLMWHNA